MKIVWTHQAYKSYWKNVEYLENYWNDNVADNFEFEILRVLEIIKKNPHIGRYDEGFDSNILLIIKQIYLVYEIKNNEIVLLNFWDNRQKPIKRLSF